MSYPSANEKLEKRQRYQKPQVIYSDTLKTRAGSPLGGPHQDNPANPFDPAGLFGSD